MSFELDHIGVAVKSLDEGSAFYSALGLPRGADEVVPEQKVKVRFFQLDNQVRIELLEPTDPSSVVQKFLDKRGGGVHHYCFRVQNIKAVLDKLKGQGVQLIDEVPRAGADGCQVAFVHPKSAGGVLIELSEKGGQG